MNFSPDDNVDSDDKDEDEEMKNKKKSIVMHASEKIAGENSLNLLK